MRSHTFGGTIPEVGLYRIRNTSTTSPLAFVLYQKTRVVEMQFEPGRPLAVDLSTTCQDYRVVIQIYTFFGIPIGTISVCDDHVDCRESFWPERLWRPRLGERTR